MADHCHLWQWCGADLHRCDARMTAMPAAQALKDWDQIKGNPGSWPVLLVGNGASMNISSTFNYKSLYATACAMGGKYQLDAVDQALFDEVETVDFELVLS